jgi:protein gp37
VADHTGIEWTDATWNPVTGCTKISPGCKNCYAERLAARLHAMGNPRYRNAFAVSLHPDLLTLPLRWRQPRRIFVNSMSDLFHEAVPDEFIQQVFAVMAKAHWHVFQILTKRSERLASLAPRLPWLANVWQGVSGHSIIPTRGHRKVPTSPAGGEEYDHGRTDRAAPEVLHRRGVGDGACGPAVSHPRRRRVPGDRARRGGPRLPPARRP